MIRSLSTILVMSLSLSLAAHVEAAPASAWQASQTIAPGVSHSRLVANSASGEIAVNTVEVDLSEPAISIEASTGFETASSAETVLGQGLRRSSEGHRTVVSINGSTFVKNSLAVTDGLPLTAANGLSVNAGELIAYSTSLTGAPWPAFGINADGSALIGIPALTVTLTLANGDVVQLSQVNRMRGIDEAVLFTPRFGTHTWTDAGGVELVLESAQLPVAPSGSYSATVSEVRSGQGDTAISSTSLVISANGSAASQLASVSSGDHVSLSVEVDAPWRSVREAIAAREQLVRAGTIDIAPVGNRSYSEAHPRTAVAITPDGRVLMVTIDGRQARSGGATVPETAQLLLDLGAQDAVNLDGGGSTTLALREPGNIDERIVNSLAEVERPVANALHVVSSAPTGPMTALAVSPSSQRLVVGDMLQLSAGGHDAAFNGVAEDPGVMTWSVTGGAVSLSSTGLLTALAPGDAVAHASAGSWAARASFRIAERGLAVGPPEASFIAGASAGKSELEVRLDWWVSSPSGPLARVELQQAIAGGPWRKVKLGGATPTGKRLTLKFDRGYQFRVRITDGDGHRTGWSVGDRFELQLIDDTDAAITRSGNWSRLSSSDAIGGQFLRTTQRDASLQLATRPASFAIVGQLGRRRGTAEIKISGAFASELQLRSPTTERRRVLYVGPPDELRPAAGMIVQVRNVSTGKRTTVDIDAFVVINLLD